MWLVGDSKSRQRRWTLKINVGKGQWLKAHEGHAFCFPLETLASNIEKRCYFRKCTWYHIISFSQSHWTVWWKKTEMYLPLPFELKVDCVHDREVEGSVELPIWSLFTIQGRKITNAVKTYVAGIASFLMWPQLKVLAFKCKPGILKNEQLVVRGWGRRRSCLFSFALLCHVTFLPEMSSKSLFSQDLF